MNQTVKIAIGSLVVGVIVLALKYAAYWVTGSVALYSDALESIVNVATAAAALLTVRIAARPADRDHPYGHNKAEYFSAMLEGAMIIVAAVLIMREAWQAVLQPRAIEAPIPGLLINGVATAINGVWCAVLIRQGRRQRSPALTADGWHLFTDVVSSIGVLLGVLLAVTTGWAVLDPLLAAVVAVNIVWSGWRVLKESTGGLMDAAVPEKTLRRIREIIAQHAEGALEAHDVRTRHAGRVTFIEFHLVVPGQMTVVEAHAICDRLEEAIKQDDEHAVVTIHVEPEHKAKHSGVLVL